MRVELLKALYQRVIDNPHVYLVVSDGEMPFLEPPLFPEIDEMTSEYEPENEEATLHTFDTKEGAEDFRQYVIEQLEAQPSKFKVMIVSLTVLWEWMDELETISHKLFGTSLKIKLLNAVTGEHVVASDVIYSRVATKH